MSDVTFSTKCYEADYRRVLGQGGARAQAERCCHAFARRQVIVNNVDDWKDAERLAMAALDRGDLSEYVFAEHHADRVLDHFRLRREDLGRGYVYSICELTELLICRTPYLVHHASDVAVLARGAGDLIDWVARGIDILEGDPRVAVVNPVWNGRVGEARAESVEDCGDHFLGHGFSDQCYLVRTDDLRGADLRQAHPAGVRYPDYGGELFEKRVDAWMRNAGRLRATLKDVAYVHPIQVRS